MAACVQAEELSLAPLGSSRLISQLKCKIERPWSGLHGPSFPCQFSAGPTLLPHVGGSQQPFSTETVQEQERSVGPKVQFVSMACLLKILPRKSADARILRLNECFQKGYIFILM